MASEQDSMLKLLLLPSYASVVFDVLNLVVSFFF